MPIHKTMIYCIKHEINKSSVDFDFHLSESEIDQLYRVSKHHDLAHIVGNYLISNGLLPIETETYRLFQKQTMLALYRYEKSNYEFNEIATLFENNHIRFIPLKGVILRDMYPVQWMRTSCDIDILIEKEDMVRATKCLIDAGLSQGVESPHDITFITSSGGHIELHHSLIEEETVSDIDCVLNEVWTRTQAHNDCLYRCDMSDEMFYFYHIAHMAKHFLFGGCGVRPFIDLWILDHIQGVDLCQREDLLKQGNLLQFAKVARRLSRVWFGNEAHDLLSRQMEEYILKGGVYGSSSNRVLLQQQKSGGRLKYALSKVFLPYDVIKFHYPILQKHRWLTPFMHVRRWCKLIFCGHLKRTTRELRFNATLSDEDAKRTQTFLDELGL